MIISHHSKFIFVHIPKTGGSSLIRFFDSPGMLLPRRFPGCKSTVDRRLDHMTVANLRTCANTDFRDFYVFSIVRNPYDRFLSAYWFLKKKLEQGDSHYLGTCGTSRITCLEHLAGLYPIADQVCRPMYHWVRNEGKVDCEIYRYEDGLENILQQVELKVRADYDFDYMLPMGRLPRINSEYREDHSHYRQVIPAAVKEFIDHVYAEDFKLFGYSW